MSKWLQNKNLKEILDDLLDGKKFLSNEIDKFVLKSILIDGFTYGETADKLDITTARTGSIFKRAIRRLKGHIHLMTINEVKIVSLKLEISKMQAELEECKMRLSKENKPAPQMIKSMENIFKTPISKLKLTTRVRNSVVTMGIYTLGDLVQSDPKMMMGYRNFGAESLMELEQVLSDNNLKFGMSIFKNKNNA